MRAAWLLVVSQWLFVPRTAPPCLASGSWRRTVEEGTHKIDSHRIDKHLAPKWDRWLLPDIHQPDVRERVVESSKTLAPTSVEKCYRLLSSSIKATRRAMLITETPCVDIDLPKPGPSPSAT